MEYKAANTNVQGKNDMLVLFSFARCVSFVTVKRQVVYIYISCNVTMLPMLPIPLGVNLTYKIGHIFVMTYHRRLSLVSFKSFFTIAVSSQGKLCKLSICIFVNFNLNIKMAEKSLKTPIKTVFQTQAIIVAHSLYTSDTIWQFYRCIGSI